MFVFIHRLKSAVICSMFDSWLKSQGFELRCWQTMSNCISDGKKVKDVFGYQDLSKGLLGA